MATRITAMYRTGDRLHWVVVLQCRHKLIVSNADVKDHQLFIGKPYTCPNCKKGHQTMTLDINVSLCREVLRLALLEVKQFAPTLPVREAWVWKAGEDHWEFHFQEFFWHGSADNAYDARAKGWNAWLAKSGAPGYQTEVES